MQLTKKAEYAISAMVDIAKQGGDFLVSSKDIAERQNIPPKFIPQIIHALSKARLINSVRGAKGGVKLMDKANNVNLRQILEVIEGPVKISFKKKGDPKFTEELNKLEDGVVKLFEKTTISDLAGVKKWFW